MSLGYDYMNIYSVNQEEATRAATSHQQNPEDFQGLRSDYCLAHSFVQNLLDIYSYIYNYTIRLLPSS